MSLSNIILGIVVNLRVKVTRAVSAIQDHQLQDCIVPMILSIYEAASWHDNFEAGEEDTLRIVLFDCR